MFRKSMVSGEAAGYNPLARTMHTVHQAKGLNYASPGQGPEGGANLPNGIPQEDGVRRSGGIQSLGENDAYRPPGQRPELCQPGASPRV
jgi:hypothetical protein